MRLAKRERQEVPLLSVQISWYEGFSRRVRGTSGAKERAGDEAEDCLDEDARDEDER
jgi:hypothetical protein